MIVQSESSLCYFVSSHKPSYLMNLWRKSVKGMAMQTGTYHILSVVVFCSFHTDAFWHWKLKFCIKTQILSDWEYL